MSAQNMFQQKLTINGHLDLCVTMQTLVRSVCNNADIS